MPVSDRITWAVVVSGAILAVAAVGDNWVDRSVGVILATLVFVAMLARDSASQ